MTSDNAKMKQCPFIIKTSNVFGSELLCRGAGCMAWGYSHSNASGEIIEDSGYCKRLAKKIS